MILLSHVAAVFSLERWDFYKGDCFGNHLLHYEPDLNKCEGIVVATFFKHRRRVNIFAKSDNF